MPKISIIVPCYNQGEYINAAIDSVLRQDFQDFEIVVVNDGSTDYHTNQLLATYDKPKTTVINYYDNRGVSFARNCAIKKSSGKYILPLDADDIIGQGYLREASDILDKNRNTGIVYSEAEYFGAKNEQMKLQKFDIKEMLIENMIFSTAMYRRADFDKTSGYNENMIHGYEDWDFWLSILELNVGVYKIPKTFFYYRIKNQSRNRDSMEDDLKKFSNYEQLMRNHRALFSKNMDVVINKVEVLHDCIVVARRNLTMTDKNSFHKMKNVIMRFLKK